VFGIATLVVAITPVVSKSVSVDVMNMALIKNPSKYLGPRNHPT
jgi:hypothetical protein